MSDGGVFKFTSIPQPLPSLQTKNAASLYIRNDAQTVFNPQKRKTDVEYNANIQSKKQQSAQALKESRATKDGATPLADQQNGDTDMSGSASTPQASTSKSPTAEQELAAAPAEPGSRTIVLQLGSASARIGLASQSTPHVEPFVIARPDPKAATYPPAHSDLVDPALDPKIDTMRVELRSRMRSYKVHHLQLHD